MSKFIPTDNKPEEIGNAVNGIMDGMKAGIKEEQISTNTMKMASGPITTEQYYATGSPYTTEAPVVPSINLPKLNKVEDQSVKLQD